MNLIFRASYTVHAEKIPVLIMNTGNCSADRNVLHKKNISEISDQSSASKLANTNASI